MQEQRSQVVWVQRSEGLTLRTLALSPEQCESSAVKLCLTVGVVMSLRTCVRVQQGKAHL